MACGPDTRVTGHRQARDGLHDAAHAWIIEGGDNTFGAVGDRCVVNDDDLELGVVDPQERVQRPAQILRAFPGT